MRKPSETRAVIIRVALTLILLAIPFHAGADTGGVAQAQAQANAPLQVVVTIAPLHSLAASVLDGVAEPVLFIRSNRSPHEFRVRPSDIEKLSNADLIVRVDETFETGLTRPISRLGNKVEILSFMTMKGVKLIPFRGGVLERGAPPETEHVHDADNPNSYDPHLWLDVENAVQFAAVLGRTIVRLRPISAARIRANTLALEQRLRALDGELSTLLKPIRDKPFITYHDAYHYFERRYGLNALGAVATDAHIGPGLRHITGLRNIFRANRAQCLFTEPQFPPKLATRLISGTPARLATLDPLGAGLDPGPDQYFALMRALGKNLAACLSQR